MKESSRMSRQKQLFASIGRFGNRSAIIQENGNRYSYSELVSTADQLVKSLKPRSLLLMLCSNKFDSICCYVGALRNDIVPMLLPNTLHDETIAQIVEQFRPSYIWIEAQRENDFYVSDIIKSTENYILYSTPYCDNPIPINDSLSLLLPTSGSTAVSQMVRLSMRNLISNAESILDYLPVNSSDRVMLTLPMNYSFGLSIINTHLITGAAILLPTQSLLDAEFWNYFSQEQTSTFGGVPYTYKILERIGFFSSEKTYPNLTYITQAGGKLPLQLNKLVSTWCHKHNIDFFVMYGQTEATARIAYLPANMSIHKLGSIGKAIKHGTLWLENEQGTIINEAMREGELCYRGPNVGLGYADNFFDLKLGNTWNGILHTGDIAYRDNENYYYIAGRKKRFIKVFGKRINLDSLDHLLAHHGYQCACRGKDDSLVVYTETRRCKNEIISVLVDIGKLPAAIITVKEIDTLPRNETGKILYAQLEAPADD